MAANALLDVSAPFWRLAAIFLDPREKHLKDVLELGLISGTMPYRILDVAAQPPRSKRETLCVDTLGNLGERACFERRARQIDLHPPARVVATLYDDARRMLPCAIALT